MKRLIEGVLEYRRREHPLLESMFSGLAAMQEPHTFFITCADSRLVPNIMLNGAPGTLFSHRSVGNIIPPSVDGSFSAGDVSEPAALEYAVAVLKVQDIILCGHSDCGAMKAALANNVPAALPNLARWIANASPRSAAPGYLVGPDGMADHDKLSRSNVLRQVENIRSYDVVKTAEASGALRVHAWWFEVGTGDIYVWEPELSAWTELDEEEAERILARLPE